MDLSKLPKLSQTKEQTEQQGQTTSAPAEPPVPTQPYASAAGYCQACGLPLRPGAKFCDSCGVATPRTGVPTMGNAAEAWLSIALGVILLFVGPRLLEYLFSPSTFPAKWTFQDEQGASLAYTKSVYFFGDVALTSFAVVLIVEGLVLFLGRRPLLMMLAFGLTVVATILNLLYVLSMMQKGYGFQLISVMAVAFGVYIAIQQWTAIKFMRAS